MVTSMANGDGQKVMSSLDDLIYKYNAVSSPSYKASGQDKWKQQKVNP
jgi:hypothetical protein